MAITIVASDGSAIKSETSETGFNGSAGFVGIIFDKNEAVKRFSDVVYMPSSTNNITEISAFIMAMKAVESQKEDGYFIFLLDSQYLIDSVTKWYYAWKNQLKKNPELKVPYTKARTPVKNWDLLVEAHNLFYKFHHAFIYKIRSHIPEDEYEKRYKEFLSENQCSLSYELWTEFRKLNEECDKMVQSCSYNGGK